MATFHLATLTRAHMDGLGRFAFLPFAEVLKSSPLQTEARWKDEIAELLAHESAIAVRVESDANTCGFAICVPSPWESAILGKSMWAIRHIATDAGTVDSNDVARRLVAEINRRAKAQGADFLSCKISASNPVAIHALESNNFLLMDSVLDFVCDCRKAPPKGASLPTGVALRLATPADADGLVQTARASFAEHFGRFHSDPRIGRTSAIRIYEEWIRSCVNGWADWVFIATHRDQIAGYSAWKRVSPLDARHGLRLGHYSIGSVHPAFFGHGIFTALTHAGMSELSKWAEWIEGPTHIENIAVQRGYLRLGWKNAGAKHSFHKWLKP